VAAYAVNQDGNTVKLRPRLMGSEHSSRPEPLVAEVRNVRLAVSCCYEDPVLVDHGESLRLRARAQGEHEPANDTGEQLARRAPAVIERG
jgi:hypothetical protein